MTKRTSKKGNITPHMRSIQTGPECDDCPLEDCRPRSPRCPLKLNKKAVKL